MATVRLDATAEATLKQLALERGQSKSSVLRDAITRLAEDQKGATSAFERLSPFVGIADSGGRQLSTRTGEKVKDLLREKHHARRAR